MPHLETIAGQWRRCSEASKYDPTRQHYMEILPMVRTRIENKKREAESRQTSERQGLQVNTEEDEEAEAV